MSDARDLELKALSKHVKKMTDDAPASAALVEEFVRSGVREEAFESGITGAIFSGIGGLIGGLVDRGASVDVAGDWASQPDALWPDQVPISQPFYSFAHRMRSVWHDELEKACLPGCYPAARRLLTTMLLTMMRHAHTSGFLG